MGQRYLIVLDDIWDIRAWNDLKLYFPDQNNGSRIIFTSRNNLAWQDELKCVLHPLRGFSDEESLELLHKKVFHKEDCPQDLIQVSRKIAKDCKGLPLSIVLVAGLLAMTKDSLVCWEMIAESLSSGLSSEGCIDKLELSYKHLPNHLKPCFLYFGVFAKDKQIRVRKLACLWIAEGFVQKTDTISAEDMAMEYMMELINRSLVTVAERNSKGGIKACSVHDVLHDFCLRKATEENFLQWIRDHGFFDPIMYKQYRLCIDPEVQHFIPARTICLSVYSLSFICQSKKLHSINSCIFEMFRFLKVLELRSVKLKSSFPEAISLIIHLRYLAISGRISYIPPTLANLWNLETFIVEGEVLHSVHLPETFWKMRSLRHVDVCQIAYVSFGDHKVKDSDELENLQTLSLVYLCKERDTQILLKRLPRLRKLSCAYEHYMNCYKTGYKLPVFSSLTELDSLTVCYADDFRPFLQINSLTFPRTLRKLTLSKFRLSWRGISTTGQLPNLEVFKLREMAFERFTWYVKDEEFVSLKFLEIRSSEIEEWNAANEPFPNLQQLVLTDCNNLKGIPSGFANIYTLKTIKLRCCCFKVESSARKIVEEQRDMGNNDLRLVCL